MPSSALSPCEVRQIKMVREKRHSGRSSMAWLDMGCMSWRREDRRSTILPWHRGTLSVRWVTATQFSRHWRWPNIDVHIQCNILVFISLCFSSVKSLGCFQCSHDCTRVVCGDYTPCGAGSQVSQSHSLNVPVLGSSEVCLYELDAESMVHVYMYVYT